MSVVLPTYGLGARPQYICMKLFQYLKQRQSRRRYRAALTIYLASYTYTHLSSYDKNRITDWIRNLIDGKFNPAFSFMDFQLFLPVRAKATFWAVAMHSLGIPPAVPREVWLIPSKSRWGNIRLANKMMLDWRSFSPTTIQAQDYLKSKGVDVTNIDLEAK